MTHRHLVPLFLVAATGLAAQQATAPAPSSTPPPAPASANPPPGQAMLPLPFRAPPEARSHLSFGFGMGSGFSLDIRGVGNIPAPTLPATNSTGGFSYSDGYVLPDSSTTPDGFTSNFAYENASQRTTLGTDNVLQYNVYGAKLTTDLLDRDAGTGIGWDVQYERDLGRIGKTRWGMVGGFAFNGADTNVSEELTGTLVTTRDSYNFGSTAIPTGADNGPYTGVFVRPTTLPLLGPLNPSQRQTFETAGAATINGNYELDAAFYHFRLGPSFMMPVGQRFAVSASLGLASTVASARFTSRQDLVDSTDSVLSSTDETATDRDISVGAYADARAHFRVNRAFSVFGGVNYVGTSGTIAPTIPDATNGDKVAEVDVGSNVSVSTGFRFSF